jgi:hypothetical protein
LDVLGSQVRRVAEGCRASGHVPGNHATGAYQSIVTDGHAWQDDCAAPDPDIAAYVNWATKFQPGGPPSCIARVVGGKNRPDVTRELVEEWYKARAPIKFAERLELNLKRFPDPESFRPNRLMVKELAQRWGSMSPTKRPLLNRRLIWASVDTIDYVITHESYSRAPSRFIIFQPSEASNARLGKARREA